ncbi:MAG: TetR/AcrR family transcriptional regulator [Rhodoglobus sp.]
MDLKETRRRGSELENAILDAAWLELTENGYAAFTFESVAARAETSRPVLYRRWADRGELMLAAMDRAQVLAPVEVPDTGDLRTDVVTLLRRINDARAGFAAVLSAQLGEYYRETGTSLADVRNMLLKRPGNSMTLILDRAAARGQLDRSKITPRVLELPSALMRHELLMTLRPVSPEVIDEIVDEIWFPLLRDSGALLPPPK